MPVPMFGKRILGGRAGPQWVRFASPQLAPRALAPRPALRWGLSGGVYVSQSAPQDALTILRCVSCGKTFDLEPLLVLRQATMEAGAPSTPSAGPPRHPSPLPP